MSYDSRFKDDGKRARDLPIQRRDTRWLLAFKKEFAGNAGIWNREQEDREMNGTFRRSTNYSWIEMEATKQYGGMPGFMNSYGLRMDDAGDEAEAKGILDEMIKIDRGN